MEEPSDVGWEVVLDSPGGVFRKLFLNWISTRPELDKQERKEGNNENYEYPT